MQEQDAAIYQFFGEIDLDSLISRLENVRTRIVYDSPYLCCQKSAVLQHHSTLLIKKTVYCCLFGHHLQKA